MLNFGEILTLQVEMSHSMFSLCWHYLSKNKKLFFIALLFGGLYGLMSGFGLPIIFEKVFRKIFETPESFSFTTIFLIAGLVPTGFFVRGLCGYLSTYWMHRCGLEVLARLRYDIFKKLQTLPFEFFDHKHTGDIIHRVISDPKCLQEVLLEMASDAIKQPLQMLAALVCLVYLSLKHCDLTLLFIFIIAIPICFLPVRLLRFRVKNNSRVMQQTEAEVTTCVSENIQAAQEVRAFNLEEFELDKINGVMKRLTQQIQTVIMWQKMQQPLMEIVSTLIISVVFIYAYFNQIPFSVFSAMGAALYFAFDPIKKITNLIGIVQKSTGAFERILEILNHPVAIASPAKNAYRGSSTGAFVIENIAFHYKNNPDNVLQNISFEIPKHKFYALVGQSGAGKSTFIKLLPRLYDVTEGHIRLDGVDLKQWDLKALRQQMSLVSQSTVLFNDTLMNNLRLGNFHATEEEIIEAAKLAYAHDFIMEAGGYNVFIGENGNRFSGGQRQRLAIARAFLKKAPVLILDEATSALDSESEFLIKKAIENISENKTIIAIAHRISTIQNADCILVFDKGHLVAQGKHNTLLSENLLYKHLVEKQLVNA